MDEYFITLFLSLSLSLSLFLFLSEEFLESIFNSSIRGKDWVVKFLSLKAISELHVLPHLSIHIHKHTPFLTLSLILINLNVHISILEFPNI